jgi:DNA-binding transcriptional regulator YhcF (GntR family)
MNYNFTDRTRKVLALAREMAVRLGHDSIGPGHILLGVVREGNGVAVAALAGLGVESRQVIERAAPGPRPKGGMYPTKAPGELAYSPSGRTVLQYAMAAAREMGHAYVGTEHLLLGVLQVEEETGPSVLNGLGVTLERVRSEIAKLLGARLPTDLVIEIDDQSNVPIVEQIVARVREAVAEGRLVPGTELPEVRRLADRLDISTGTVARAYAELDRAGVVISAGDVPPLVAGPRATPEQEDPDALATLFRPIVGLAHRMGVKADDLRAALARAMADIYESRS